MLASIGRSLRRKVMVLVLGTTAAALALSALALAIYDLRNYARASTADILSQADVLGRASAPALSFGDRRDAEKDLSMMRVRPHVTVAALYDRDNRLFATYASRDGDTAGPAPSVAGEEGARIREGTIEAFRRVTENGEMVGTVYLHELYDPWPRLVDYLSIIVMVMVASLGLAALLLARWQGTVTTPILEVARVSREVMDRRDFSQRVARTTHDEVGQLVDAFNAMIAEVGRRTDALRLADQRKDEFLATLAHELRNPLAPIRNALEILRRVGDHPEKSRRARDMMERQVSQMVRLVDDLLDVSRITTGKLAVRKAVIDLRGPLRDAVEIARPYIDSRRHVLEVAIPNEPLTVEGDRTRLAQVFSNLLNNAAKYTPPGGRIAMAVAHDDREARVSIIDAGIGIDAESLSRIFDMFVQVDISLDRSTAGLGVGLTLARRLAELHGGTLEAASEGVGKGSTFLVRLPLSTLHLDDAQRDARDPGATHAERRVLLADDNQDFATSLADILLARGHDVRVARDGEEALRMAAEFRPEVAFLDIGMPKLHGYEVARRMRADPVLAACTLVAVTGWGQESDRLRSREAGFDRHLTKPVNPADIESILEA